MQAADDPMMRLANGSRPLTTDKFLAGLKSLSKKFAAIAANAQSGAQTPAAGTAEPSALARIVAANSSALLSAPTEAMTASGGAPHLRMNPMSPALQAPFGVMAPMSPAVQPPRMGIGMFGSPGPAEHGAASRLMAAGATPGSDSGSSVGLLLGGGNSALGSESVPRPQPRLSLGAAGSGAVALLSTTSAAQLKLKRQLDEAQADSAKKARGKKWSGPEKARDMYATVRAAHQKRMNEFGEMGDGAKMVALTAGTDRMTYHEDDSNKLLKLCESDLKDKVSKVSIWLKTWELAADLVGSMKTLKFGTKDFKVASVSVIAGKVEACNLNKGCKDFIPWQAVLAVLKHKASNAPSVDQDPSEFIHQGKVKESFPCLKLVGLQRVGQIQAELLKSGLETVMNKAIYHSLVADQAQPIINFLDHVTVVPAGGQALAPASSQEAPPALAAAVVAFGSAAVASSDSQPSIWALSFLGEVTGDIHQVVAAQSLPKYVFPLSISLGRVQGPAHEFTCTCGSTRRLARSSSIVLLQASVLSATAAGKAGRGSDGEQKGGVPFFAGKS